MVSRFVAALAFTAVLISQVFAQEKPAEKKELPKVILANPLAIMPGANAKITLRGTKLDQATEVKLAGFEVPPAVAVKKKEKSAPPNGLNANEVGDSLVEVEFALPGDFAGSEVQLVVTNPDGSTEPYSLLVLKPDELVTESEPNEAFRKCGVIKPSQTIIGSIQQQRDVDVFAIEAAEGSMLVAETISLRRGSALDPLLSLYDERGQVLASSDDGADDREASIKFKMPAGKVYLTLMDALDRGSAGHPYLLRLRTE